MIYQCDTIRERTDIEHIYYADDEGYAQRTESYWSLTSQLEPDCYVQPKSTQEVSAALQVIVEHTDCDFAVRSGGHSANAGANNIDGGVTIDLGEQNTVSPFSCGR